MPINININPIKFSKELPSFYMDHFCKKLHPRLQVGPACASWFQQATNHCAKLIIGATQPNFQLWDTLKHFIFPKRQTALLNNKIPVSVNPERLSKQDCNALFLDIVNDYNIQAPRCAIEAATNALFWNVFIGMLLLMALTALVFVLAFAYSKWQKREVRYDGFTPTRRIEAAIRRNMRVMKYELKRLRVQHLTQPEEIFAPDGTSTLVMKMTSVYDVLQGIVTSNVDTTGRFYKIYGNKSDYKTHTINKAMKFINSYQRKLHILLLFDEDPAYDELLGKRKSRSPLRLLRASKSSRNRNESSSSLASCYLDTPRPLTSGRSSAHRSSSLEQTFRDPLPSQQPKPLEQPSEQPLEKPLRASLLRSPKTSATLLRQPSLLPCKKSPSTSLLSSPKISATSLHQPLQRNKSSLGSLLRTPQISVTSLRQPLSREESLRQPLTRLPQSREAKRLEFVPNQAFHSPRDSRPRETSLRESLPNEALSQNRSTHIPRSHEISLRQSLPNETLLQNRSTHIPRSHEISLRQSLPNEELLQLCSPQSSLPPKASSPRQSVQKQAVSKNRSLRVPLPYETPLRESLINEALSEALSERATLAHGASKRRSLPNEVLSRAKSRRTTLTHEESLHQSLPNTPSQKRSYPSAPQVSEASSQSQRSQEEFSVNLDASHDSSQSAAGTRSSSYRAAASRLPRLPCSTNSEVRSGTNQQRLLSQIPRQTIRHNSHYNLKRTVDK